MPINATRIEQIIRAARPLRFSGGTRAKTMAASTFIAAMAIIHQHEGERMPTHRFADLMQIADSTAWDVLKTLTDAGFIARTFTSPKRDGGRATGTYTIRGQALVEATEAIEPRRKRRAA